MNSKLYKNSNIQKYVSSFIDSGPGFASPIWFVLALVLNSKNNFINSKLTIWVWCDVAIMNGRTAYAFTDAS